VRDNSHAVPHLGDPRLLVVAYEEFADEATVLGVLRRLAAHVGAPASDERLLLALQPPSRPLQAGHQCAVYGGKQAKAADLAASYLSLLGARGLGTNGDPPLRLAVSHNRYRSWQASQAWMPQRGATWPSRLTCRQQDVVMAGREMRDMLQRFGYSMAPPPGSNATACLS
jgi:hypothetical protein